MHRFLLLPILLAAGTPALAEDEAHRADRLRTQQLNRQAQAFVEARDRRPAASDPSYRAARARYARDMAAWRAQVEACEAGDVRACR